jgi:hypothetical protein
LAPRVLDQVVKALAESVGPNTKPIGEESPFPIRSHWVRGTQPLSIFIPANALQAAVKPFQAKPETVAETIAKREECGKCLGKARVP